MKQHQPILDQAHRDVEWAHKPYHFLQALYISGHFKNPGGRMKGGSAWASDQLPYVLELDNSGCFPHTNSGDMVELRLLVMGKPFTKIC